MKAEIQRLCNRTLKYLDYHSSTILTVLAGVGVVATAVTAVRATFEAIEIIENDSRKNHDGDPYVATKKEAVQSAWKCYIPTITIGTVTISCLAGANILNKKHQASLLSVYAAANKYYKDYKAQVIEAIGEEAEKEIRHEIIRNRSDHHWIDIDTPDDKLLFYEPYSDTYISRYEREIMDAEYHLNRNFVFNGYSSLNDFYDFLGIPHTELGDEIGWSTTEGYMWIDFEHELFTTKDGREAYVINMIFPPDMTYLEDWM